jgi:hypothetical protein
MENVAQEHRDSELEGVFFSFWQGKEAQFAAMQNLQTRPAKRTIWGIEKSYILQEELKSIQISWSRIPYQFLDQYTNCQALTVQRRRRLQKIQWKLKAVFGHTRREEGGAY